MEEGPDCYQCHATMSLNDGCDWPDDPTLILCGGCAITEIERLREAAHMALGHIDYIRNLSGDEAIMRRVADTLRAALQPPEPRP